MIGFRFVVRLFAFILQPLLALCLLGGYPLGVQARTSNEPLLQTVENTGKAYQRDRLGSSVRQNRIPDGGTGIGGHEPEPVLGNTAEPFPNAFTASRTQNVSAKSVRTTALPWPCAAPSTAPPLS